MVVVAVGFSILNLVGKVLAALKPSTTTIPSLTFNNKCVFSESFSKFIIKHVNRRNKKNHPPSLSIFTGR